MITKLTLLLLLVVSCGPKEVKFPSGSEAISQVHVTNAAVQTDKTGTFTKAPSLNGSIIVYNGQNYPFSEYSSYQALNYYSAKQMGSTSNVAFRGDVVSGKMVVELIQDQ